MPRHNSGGYGIEEHQHTTDESKSTVPVEAGIPLPRQPELSLTRSERAQIRANWQEFTAHTFPPGISFKRADSPLSDDLLQYCQQHSLIDQTDDGQWETSEDLWLFLLENAAADETIGAHVDEQKRVIDAYSREKRE
jgi:hypothetical protein